MTPTLRAELDRIEDFLMGPEGGLLMDVLSALRGPDEPTKDHKKAATTVHIRAAAFPRLAASSGRFTDNGKWQIASTVSFRRPDIGYDYGHFESHINKAAEHLGLL